MNNPNVHLDWDNLTDIYMKASECGDRETMRQVTSQIKISPSKALVGLQVWGKEEFLALGYDLSLVESELGKDWADQYARH